MAFHNNTEFDMLLKELSEMLEFKKAYYYIKAMKKTPHNGVFYNESPNAFLKYTPPFYCFFVSEMDIPYPIVKLKDLVYSTIKKYCIDETKIFEFTFGYNEVFERDKFRGDKNYVLNSGNILKLKDDTNNRYTYIDKAIRGEIHIYDYFYLDSSRLLYAFILYLICCDLCSFQRIEDIIKLEEFTNDHDKYKLTDITTAEFEMQGYIFESEYYLYNIFLDTSIENSMPSVPHIIKIIKDKEIKNLSIMMRCDKTLCVNQELKVSTAGVGFEKWRGINFRTQNIENKIIKNKEVIVHYDPETLNKLLCIIKYEDNNGNEYYHISIEQLWSLDKIHKSDCIVTTNFVHGCYYPNMHSFDHIDFSVNQYEISNYEEKYSDYNTQTIKSIEKYSDLHYKVWCIKGDNLDMDLWAQLVCYTLDYPFRKLFAEMIGGDFEQI
ncbi:MAG: hypothetical protein IK999_08770 [Ruminococcus sp.]|nr:hypothetical protein [Ruminococcus sp.]